MACVVAKRRAFYPIKKTQPWRVALKSTKGGGWKTTGRILPIFMLQCNSALQKQRSEHDKYLIYNIVIHALNHRKSVSVFVAKHKYELHQEYPKWNAPCVGMAKECRSSPRPKAIIWWRWMAPPRAAVATLRLARWNSFLRALAGVPPMTSF